MPPPGPARSTTVVAGRWTPGATASRRCASRAATPTSFTARMLAWAAEQVAGGALRGAGALGPVDAFGLDLAEAGTAESGIARAG